MEIRHLEFAEGAARATGVAVIIDVFRAFTTACYLYHQGVREVLVTGDPRLAFAHREKDPQGTILVGERNEKKIEGFDMGNSPSEVLRHDLHGKVAVLTTSAGTRGIMQAVKATRILAAAFVNASATARFLRKIRPPAVSLVAMGYNAVTPADEDRLCARYIEDLLRNRKSDLARMERIIRQGTGRRFFDPSNMNSPEEDYYLAMETDRFPYVLEALPSATRGLLLLKKSEA